MKKITYNKYGDAAVLRMTQTVKPKVSGNNVLVKVKAVSINPLDWKIFEGEMKLLSGSKFPKNVGIDFSGVIEEVGNEVSLFKKGDEVFGLLDVFKGGALAEYITVNQNAIVDKPENISFDQAAALPVVGSSALQIFDKLASIKSGADVFINGASGGIGMFAVQIAKNKGAYVTAATSARGIAPAVEWGADEAIDYKSSEFLKSNKKYDIVIDLSGSFTFEKAKTILKPKAVFISTLPSPLTMIKSALHNLFSSQKHKILVLKPNKEYLQNLSILAKDGLKIHIDKTYLWDDFKIAFEETKRNGAIGKNTINLY
jgi:NADPH:quinone reductase-like Zn-dependent oxidoreductase